LSCSLETLSLLNQTSTDLKCYQHNV